MVSCKKNDDKYILLLMIYNKSLVYRILYFSDNVCYIEIICRLPTARKYDLEAIRQYNISDMTEQIIYIYIY